MGSRARRSFQEMRQTPAATAFRCSKPVPASSMEAGSLFGRDRTAAPPGAGYQIEKENNDVTEIIRNDGGAAVCAGRAAGRPRAQGESSEPAADREEPAANRGLPGRRRRARQPRDRPPGQPAARPWPDGRGGFAEHPRRESWHPSRRRADAVRPADADRHAPVPHDRLDAEARRQGQADLLPRRQAVDHLAETREDSARQGDGQLRPRHARNAHAVDDAPKLLGPLDVPQRPGPFHDGQQAPEAGQASGQAANEGPARQARTAKPKVAEPAPRPTAAAARPAPNPRTPSPSVSTRRSTW